MSCFVCQESLIARVAVLICDVIQYQGRDINLRYHLADAMQRADREPIQDHVQALHELPVRDGDCCLSYADMAAILTALNYEAYYKSYPHEAHDIDLEFWGEYYGPMRFPRIKWNDMSADELAGLIKSLECYIYQCCEYGGMPQYIHVLRALKDEMYRQCVQMFVPGYNNAKWGE